MRIIFIITDPARLFSSFCMFDVYVDMKSNEIRLPNLKSLYEETVSSGRKEREER